MGILNEQAKNQGSILDTRLEEIFNGTTEEGQKQDGITVTKGDITLKVGQSVTGYTGNSVGDGSWYVLGAGVGEEAGKLLITTNRNLETITLGSQEGYVNGVNTLNTNGEKYSDGNMAYKARSINLEDINRVTKYDPDIAQYDVGDTRKWKNEVTYTLTGGKIYYQGTKYPTTNTASSYTGFIYWDGTNWTSLSSSKPSVKFTHNFYYYDPQTLTTSLGLGANIKDHADSTEVIAKKYKNLLNL